MMVRFSDILGDEKKKGKESSSSEPGQVVAPPQDDTRIKKGQMTDSQILSPEEITDFSGPFLTDRYSEDVKKYYAELLEKAAEIRDRVKANRGLSHSPILSLLHDIIDQDLIDQLYEYALSLEEDKGVQSHTVTVTLACMKVGKGMGYDDTKKLLRLGLSAFLENVGMYKIPEHILQKQGKLSPEEMAVIRKHPVYSAQIVGQMGKAFKWLEKIVLQVHERSDGSGYPKGLKGGEITEESSIIGLIDIFVAMVKNRPYRNKLMQTEAIKSIIDIGKSKFPSRVLKEFLNQISLFPVNTYVKLNNKSIGRVLSTNKSQPLRPTIELLYDGLGQEMEKGKLIDLSNFPLLHIVDTIDERELP